MQVKIHEHIQKDSKAREKELHQMQKIAPDDVVTQYAEGLFSLRSHQYDDAKKTFESLLKTDKRNASYLIALSNALTGQEKNQEAEALLGEALATQPGHHALTMAYAQTLMLNSKAETARQKLMSYIALPDREPNVYQLLASAQEASGHADEVHESHGLYLQAIGDLRGALQQFEMARRSRSSDPYSTTRINARIKHIQQILLERRNNRR
jgi:predicted Zn-dependent protease